jgi:hypothetical protein
MIEHRNPRARLTWRGAQLSPSNDRTWGSPDRHFASASCVRRPNVRLVAVFTCLCVLASGWPASAGSDPNPAVDSDSGRIAPEADGGAPKAAAGTDRPTSTSSPAVGTQPASPDKDDHQPPMPVTTLSDVQKPQTLVLRPARQPYRLQGEYVVPPGKKLTILPGTVIQCDRDSALSVSGTIEITGAEREPVVFRGAASRVGLWKGLTIAKGSQARLAYMHVFDAMVTVNVLTAKPSLTGCVLAGNEFGLKGGVYGAGSAIEVADTVIAFNAKDGLNLYGSTIKLSDSTVSNNGGWGIFGAFYPRASLQRCVVTKNRGGGITLNMYDAFLEAHGSCLAGNTGFDVVNDVAADWDLTGNWWGPQITAILRTKGVTANLPTIKDGLDDAGKGKARLSDFLPKAPIPCGAKCTTVAGRSVR